MTAIAAPMPGSASSGILGWRYRVRPLHWLAMATALAIAVLMFAFGWFMTNLMLKNTLERDAEIMMRFINSIVRVEAAQQFFISSGSEWGAGDIEEFMIHMGHMPGVLRTKVYGLNREVIFSTDEGLIGLIEANNHELEEAFLGKPVIETGTVGEDSKAEHADLPDPGLQFVENYLPIWSSGDPIPTVIGVVEVYRIPTKLFEEVVQGRQIVWFGSASGGLIMFAVLAGIIWRTDGMIERQQSRLLQAQRMAAVGEMAAAVAHGLRNPLASIRSSAELALESDLEPEDRELMEDVIGQSDRLEGWVRQYLAYASTAPELPARAEVEAVIFEATQQIDSTLARKSIRLETGIQNDCPAVRIDPHTLLQVTNSLIANAVEVLPAEGSLEIRASAIDGPEPTVAIRIEDDGPGMSVEGLANAFKPFSTTKTAGLGIGLPLARQIVERHGGSLNLASKEGQGTVATITLPQA